MTASVSSEPCSLTRGESSVITIVIILLSLLVFHPTQCYTLGLTAGPGVSYKMCQCCSRVAASPAEAVRGVRGGWPVCESRRLVIPGSRPGISQGITPSPSPVGPAALALPHPPQGTAGPPIPWLRPSPKSTLAVIYNFFFCIYFSHHFISFLKYTSKPQIDPTHQASRESASKTGIGRVRTRGNSRIKNQTWNQ